MSKSPNGGSINDMSYRDYMAAVVLNGLVMSADVIGTPAALAATAYDYAQAMLRERNQRNFS